MDISTGNSENHPTPLPIDPQPRVAPGTPVSGDSMNFGAARDTTGEQLAQLAAQTADIQAAQTDGISAEHDRRAHYGTDLGGHGGSYGDPMSLPQPPAGPGVGLSDVDLPIKGAGY